MAEPSTAAVTPNSLAPSSSPLLAPSPVGPLVHPKQEPGAWNDLVSSYGAAMLPTVMYPTMNIKCSPDSPPPPPLSLHHQHDDHHSDVDEELSMIAAKHHQAVNNNSLSLDSGPGPKMAVAPIWNPGNISPVASLPPPLPTSVHPSYHPMLMMKMMMMNMEHKASLAAAGLNPMSAGAHHLFARLNEFNQMAAAAAAAAASSSMPSQTNFEHPSESQSTLAQVGLQQANLQLQASTGDGNSVSKPKRVRNRKSAVNGGSPRSRSTKAVSANRRLVPSTLLSQSDPTAPPKLGNPIYRCHLCPYTGNSKLHFNAHMNTHFDHRCPHCDYTSRTEGRLKRHIRDFHSETPPETWSGNRAKDSDNDNPGLGPDGEVLSGDDSNAGSGMCAGGNGPNPARNRKYRCKQCNYVAIQKHDYWEHTKQHIKTDKMLNCPKCNFVTEFKHHLVYHLRNHFGSKPFKCAKCNYSCVNKSMLNSHMKSHSNIYQYRCEDCTYATKYCHSLKLHLRKYAHRPATVLNLDGTPNPYPVIDVYGTRRGPRPKKGSAAAATFGSDGDGDEEMMDEEIERTVAQNLSMDLSSSASSSTSEPNHPSTPPPAPQAPVMGQVAVVVPQPKLSSDSTMVASHRQNGGSSSNAAGANYLKCDYCPFQTESKQEFSNHLLNHVMNEKQSLVNSRKNASSRVKSSTTQQSNHQQVSNKEQQHSSLPVVGSQSTTPPLTPGSGALSASPFELPLALESPIQNQAYPPFLTPFHHHSQQHHQPADFMTFGSHHHPRTLPTSTPPTFPHQFTCGELTPPTPTDETEAAAAKQAETPFKPLDLSGKVHHNHNQVQVASPERSKEQADGFAGCGGDLNESPSVGTNPTMALILMNSLLLNAQRNLKDALENASEASSSPEPSVASGGASRPESVNSLAVPSPAVEDELKHRARSLKRKGRANRLDLSKLANSDEEEEDEEEMEAEEENELENGFVEQENSLNYFEMLKNVPLTNESYDESANEDNSSERDEPERYHQLPPTPTKSPKQLLQQQQQSSRQSTNIFDFTDESQSNQMMADQNGGVGSMLVTSPQQIQQQHPSAGLSPAIVQLLAQMLQTNPSLNPALVVQQLLPQLLLEGNCNLDSITALLTKVYSATSLMQDILLEMCAAKK